MFSVIIHAFASAECLPLSSSRADLEIVRMHLVVVIADQGRKSPCSLETVDLKVLPHLVLTRFLERWLGVEHDSALVLKLAGLTSKVIVHI